MIAPSPDPFFRTSAVLESARGEGGGAAYEGREVQRRGAGVPYFDPASDPVLMDALRLLFAKEGNYVQDLVRTASFRKLIFAADLNYSKKQSPGRG